MKAFGYCRISVANDEGVSLAHQQDRIKAWATANGHELVQIYTEVRSADSSVSIYLQVGRRRQLVLPVGGWPTCASSFLTN